MNAKQVLDKLQDGDVLNWDGKLNIKNAWWLGLPYFLIRSEQKRIYNAPIRPGARWRDTHTTQFFKRDNTILSAELPVVKLWDAEQYIDERLKDGDVLTVARWRELEALPDALHVQACVWMHALAEDFKGRKYDVGQLVDDLLNRVLGYGTTDTIHWFDGGSGRKVCSALIRTTCEYARKKSETAFIRPLTRLFNSLKPECWTAKEWNVFKRVDVEKTYPATWVNSQFYADDMRIVLL